MWRVPGNVAGRRRGAAAGRRSSTSSARRAASPTARTCSELRWALADGDHAVAVYRARGKRLGRELDIDQVLLITLRDGRWQEIVAVPTDPRP